MEFCSECGTMLMPKKKGKHIWLVCPDCGHYKKLDEEGYKFGEKKEKKGSKVVVIDEKRDRKFTEPDYDIDTDAYAEMYEDTY